MDDARFWMWEKQRPVHSLTGSSHRKLNTDAQATPHSSYDASWEERAFAEDAAGTLGGCIWPPRSYSCNFCGRDFRSAQALGGHMNVHRRDRAKLKQSLSPHEVFDQHQKLQQLQHGPHCEKIFVSSHVPYQGYSLAYNPNPNPDNFSNPAQISLALKSSSPSANGSISNTQEPNLLQLGLRELQKRLPNIDMVAGNTQPSDLKLDADIRGPQLLQDLGEGALMHCCEKPDISVSLNLFLVQTQVRKRSKNEYAEDDWDNGDGDNNIGSKRRKITVDESSTMSSSLYKKLNTVDKRDMQQKLTTAQRSTSFIHDLDLELRLGERPIVK